MKQDETLLGVRIPSGLKKELSEHCKENGLKMSFFVKQAIEERLQRSEAGEMNLTYAEKIQL